MGYCAVFSLHTDPPRSEVRKLLNLGPYRASRLAEPNSILECGGAVGASSRGTAVACNDYGSVSEAASTSL